MKKTNKHILQFFGAAAVLALGMPSAFAGGAFATMTNGTPVLWQGSVVWRAETGPIKGATDADPDGGGGGGGGGGGCQLTKNLDINNAQGIDIVRAAFAAWDNVPNASITIEEGASLGVDVNFDNVENFWVGSFFGGATPSNVTADGCYDADPATECLNSVIFDSTSVPDRSITDAIQGRCARYSVLAFAAILPQVDGSGNISSAALKSSQMVISGACVPPVMAPDPSCASELFSETACPPGGISEVELQGTVTHEVGHYLGLDHTLTNKRNYIACQTGNGDCDLENIPTMIGLFTPGADLHTLHFDDKAIFSRYYPGGGPSCTITGIVTHSGAGSAPPHGRCMEVVARKDNSDATAASFVAGAEVARISNNGSPSDCAAGDASCGTYTIGGLEPGTYNLGVQNFSDLGAGSGLDQFNIEPCHPDLADDNYRFGDFQTEPPGPGQATVVCPPGGGNVPAPPLNGE